MPASSKSVEKTGRDEFVALQITSHPLYCFLDAGDRFTGYAGFLGHGCDECVSVFGVRTEYLDFFDGQYGSHEPVVSACLASRTNKAKDFGIFARHDFHSERAGDSDSDLLDETIRHDRQQLASLRAKSWTRPTNIPLASGIFSKRTEPWRFCSWTTSEVTRSASTPSLPTPPSTDLKLYVDCGSECGRYE